MEHNIAEVLATKPLALPAIGPCPENYHYDKDLVLYFHNIVTTRNLLDYPTIGSILNRDVNKARGE